MLSISGHRSFSAALSTRGLSLSLSLAPLSHSMLRKLVFLCVASASLTLHLNFARAHLADQLKTD